jgi:hypothetical protein
MFECVYLTLICVSSALIDFKQFYLDILYLRDITGGEMYSTAACGRDKTFCECLILC